jgi:hypothetical protein
MSAQHDISGAFAEFKSVAARYCSVVDSSASLDRATLLVQIYGILPQLIHEAIALPDVAPSDQGDERVVELRITQKEWQRLYDSLKEKLGDWNLYCSIFDPTKDSEAVRGSLADDIADIYRDIKEGLACDSPGLSLQNDIIWEWRLGYYSHWGQHAMEALRTIHSLLGEHADSSER